MTVEQKKEPARVVIGVLAGLVVIVFVVLILRHNQAGAAHGNGLFSWHDAALEEPDRTALFDRMEQLGLTELYQHVSQVADPRIVQDFFASARERGIRAYLLSGSPDWALDETGQALLDAVERASSLEGCAGLMADVEPHLTPDWDQDQEAVIQRYLSAMKAAKRASRRAGLELVVCVPYYYDDKAGGTLLDHLVSEGCDALAVMNYYRKNEAGHIQTEVQLCQAYGKRLIHIYELQAPGTQGLETINTYHDAGLGALYTSWSSLQTRFTGVSMHYALHDYDALRELMDDE